MQNEIVEKRGWLTAEQFQTGWASGNVLPGPIASKVVAYVGYQRAGWLGAFVSVIAYLSPSVVGMVLLAAALSYSGGSGWVGRLMDGLRAAVRGIKPAVLALLVDAFLSFTGVALPIGAQAMAYRYALGLVFLGVFLSLAGMGWIAASNGTGQFLLRDLRAGLIFLGALSALLLFRLDTIYVMLGAAAVGLTYLWL
ncbi:MAG: hypothetical protein KatS3mg115_1745 [Candidatus Poribacteria bacterium]|nr:MAG: hypothetical protein KatS3mg115_1745 [Candidatus Poribacteria bacterium]